MDSSVKNGRWVRHYRRTEYAQWDSLRCSRLIPVPRSKRSDVVAGLQQLSHAYNRTLFRRFLDDVRHHPAQSSFELARADSADCGKLHDSSSADCGDQSFPGILLIKSAAVGLLDPGYSVADVSSPLPSELETLPR